MRFRTLILLTVSAIAEIVLLFLIPNPSLWMGLPMLSLLVAGFSAVWDFVSLPDVGLIRVENPDRAFGEDPWYWRIDTATGELYLTQEQVDVARTRADKHLGRL